MHSMEKIFLSVGGNFLTDCGLTMQNELGPGDRAATQLAGGAKGGGGGTPSRPTMSLGWRKERAP